MKHLYKRKFFVIILFMLVLFKTLNLSYYNCPKFLPMEKASRILFIKYSANTTLVILPKLQLEFYQGINPHINSTLCLFVTWKFILVALLVLKVLIIDVRRRIIELLTSYFEGG